MTWLDAPGFERRLLVFVEDHLYHTGELLDALARERADLMHEVTVCPIDREGPDTDAAVREWLTRYPSLQVAAATTPRDRLRTVTAGDLQSAPKFATFVAGLLRPGGILVQDIQLSTLGFVPADRWWESIYTAATVRGLFAERAPAVRFLSNKRGYAATFGRDLAEAGFDPREVIDKSELGSVGVPAISNLFDRQYPLTLEARLDGVSRRAWRVSESDRADIERTLHLVLWPTAAGYELGGRDVEARVGLRRGSHELTTWEALIADRLSSGDGVPVLAVGERIGPPDAGRAELTNVAARHIHTLRSRLRNSAAIVTEKHAYRIADDAAAGSVSMTEGKPSGLPVRHT